MTMNDDGDDGAGPHCSGALFFGCFDDAGADAKTMARSDIQHRGRKRCREERSLTNQTDPTAG